MNPATLQLLHVALAGHSGATVAVMKGDRSPSVVSLETAAHVAVGSRPAVKSLHGARLKPAWARYVRKMVWLASACWARAWARAE